jgi:hypothetical protein
MKLADYQRQLVALSFAPEAPEQALAALGDGERFALYRQMIRSRFLAMAKQAFRVSAEQLGSPAFDASFARFLAAEPPRSRLIRDVIASYGPFARADRDLLAGAPVFLADLLRFEEAKWRVAYRSAQAGPVAELDFQRPPLLNPALERVPVEHAVHELSDGACQPGALTLLVYRPPGIDDLRWYPATPLLAAILAGAAAQPELALATLVQQAALALGRPLDEALLEELATAVTVALQRGVLLGSRG